MCLRSTKPCLPLTRASSGRNCRLPSDQTKRKTSYNFGIFRNQNYRRLFMKKNLTEVVFILDRSGSMSGLEADTIGGFNAMIAKQRREPGEALISTVLFDSQSEVLHDRVPVYRIQPMTNRDIRPGASRRCWMPLAAPSTTSATSTSTPGKRTGRLIHCSSLPQTAWKTPVTTTTAKRSKP